MQLSHPYLPNHDDYLILLQCHEKIGYLYRERGDFQHTIDHYQQFLHLIQKYKPNDIKNLTSYYDGIITIYENEFEQVSSVRDTTSILAETVESQSVLHAVNGGQIIFERSNLAFGFYLVQSVDLCLNAQVNINRRLAYCYMKRALLSFKQNALEQTRDYLYKATAINVADARNICEENLAYLDGNYKFVILKYQQLIDKQLISGLQCVNEDYFSYIGSLYEKIGDSERAIQYYLLAIWYFELNGHYCCHTQSCFEQFILYYKRTGNDINSVINISKRFLLLLYKYRLPFIKKFIQIILINSKTTVNETMYAKLIYFILNNTNNVKQVVDNYEKLLYE
ncbi:unnamed protein product, partial [Didymodactylos carnosus]